MTESSYWVGVAMGIVIGVIGGFILASIKRSKAPRCKSTKTASNGWDLRCEHPEGHDGPHGNAERWWW